MSCLAPVDITSLLTCSRATFGWAERVDGTLQEFAADELRITDKGLLIEETRTNEIRNSFFEGADQHLPTGWARYGTEDAANTLVDGSVLGIATKFVAIRRVDTGWEGIFQSITFDDASTYSISLYARVPTGVTACDIYVAVAGGTVLIAPAASLSANWQRFEATVTTSGTSGNFVIRSQGGASGIGADIALPQFEKGGFATSFIKTTGAAATRAADQIAFSDMSWLQPGVGTILIETADVTALTFPRIIDDNSYTRLYFNTPTQVQWSNTPPFVRATMPAGDRSGAVKTAIAWDGSGRSMSVAGGAVASDATAISVNTLQIGGNPFLDRMLGGYVRSLTYWPERKTDGELQGMTG